jgi:hypothetical protein
VPFGAFFPPFKRAHEIEANFVPRPKTVSLKMAGQLPCKFFRRSALDAHRQKSIIGLYDIGAVKAFWENLALEYSEIIGLVGDKLDVKYSDTPLRETITTKINYKLSSKHRSSNRC